MSLAKYIIENTKVNTEGQTILINTTIADLRRKALAEQESQPESMKKIALIKTTDVSAENAQLRDEIDNQNSELRTQNDKIDQLEKEKLDAVAARVELDNDNCVLRGKINHQAKLIKELKQAIIDQLPTTMRQCPVCEKYGITPQQTKCDKCKIKELQEAIIKYGDHLTTCAQRQNGECDCGFNERLNKINSSRTTKEVTDDETSKK